MASLGESPCAKILREALATVRCDDLPTSSPNGMLNGWFGRSKQGAADHAPLVQEKQVDNVEPPMGQATSQDLLVVSPGFEREITSDLPDRSAEDAASIVNDLALNVSKSPPTPAVSGKRKRRETDVLEAPPKKRVARARGSSAATDELFIASSNGITGHEGGANRASSEVEKEAPGKLSRPKKEQRKWHMAHIDPAVQKDEYIWDPPPSPEKQAEMPGSPPTTTARSPQSSKATPRPPGRPRKVKKPSPTKKRTAIQEGDRRDMQGLQANSRREGRRPEGYESPEAESRESLPQEVGSKARPDVSSAKTGDGNPERAQHPRSTRSTAANNGTEDAILHAKIDLTKKPERDSRKAAKHRKNHEQVSVSTPPSAKANSQDIVKTTEINLRAEQRESLDRAKAQKASNGAQEDVAGDIEHSDGEDGEGREANGDMAREVEVAVASSEQAASQINEVEGEREEDESDFDDPSQAQDSEEAEEAAEYEYELFGQEPAWRTVLEAAGSICGAKLLHNHMPKLLTGTVKGLVNDVREARDLYRQLSSPRGHDHDSLDGINHQLRERLDKIDIQIRSLSEETAATKSSQMIKDIYARAIPAMAFLLQSALAARVYHSDESYNLNTLNGVVGALREIVRLQRMTIILCTKAKSWKAKPVPTSRPIVRPTSHKIYPNIKAMKEVFAMKLSEQERKRKSKQNAADLKRRQNELVRSSQQAKQEAARKNEILLKRIKESREEEDEIRRSEKRTFRQRKEDEVRANKKHRHLNAHTESNPLWSDEEDIALYIQLEKGYAGNLTTEERYLKILNAPLLQNKLPQHIRERALYFKPTLLEERGALEWISSIE